MESAFPKSDETSFGCGFDHFEANASSHSFLDFAVQSLVERPFELGSDEGIQILPQR
ncbi:MAG: hypothetical protein SPH43_05705 [Candidatus Enteromonas sp.]|nr:hypothetical protein [Candidatus Enteromonas sp.]